MLGRALGPKVTWEGQLALGFEVASNRRLAPGRGGAVDGRVTMSLAQGLDRAWK